MIRVLTYEQAILKIKNLEKFGSKPGLERVRKLLELIGSPQEKLKFIHVAGTNGKGSVCFMLASILKECGYKTGLFISPSIMDFRERISINGEMISKNDICKILEKLEKFKSEFSQDPLTEFEITTVMAFEYFSKENCDVVILETGMGGRLDATNIIDVPLCSVITTISLDHTNFLGKNIEEIASEKLGIVKRGSCLILGANIENSVVNMAKKVCNNLNSDLILADSSMVSDFKSDGFNKSEFVYDKIKMKVNLVGNHQKNNVCTVLSVLNFLKRSLNISDFKIKSGFEKVKVPCRIEILNSSPLIILDASHNPESVEALADFIKNNLKSKKLTALFGMFSDKDVDTSLKIIGSYFQKMIVVKSDNPRAMKVRDLKKIASKYNKNVFAYENFEEGFKFAVNSLNHGECLIIFGSFSVVSLAKKLFFSIDNFLSM